MAHKVTFRLDDDEHDTLLRIAETAGVSATSLVQAAIAVWGESWEENEWSLPREWPYDAMAGTWALIVMQARRVDADRRARPGLRGRPAPSVTTDDTSPSHNVE